MTIVDPPVTWARWVEESGYPTQYFFQMLLDLWQRTGGETDSVESSTIKLALLTLTQAVDLDAMEVKLALLTLTQAVDLDAMEVKSNFLTLTQAVDLDAIDDAITIDGGGGLTFVSTTQTNGTVTVGVNDTGYDVKFFGATSGAYMLWDESADDLKLVGAAGFTVAGDIDVDGTTNLDVVDIDGAVDMASTLAVAGVLTGASLDISGNIDVDGVTNLDVVDIDGAVDMASTLAVAGVLTGASLDISGDIDVDGTANLDVVDIDGAVDMATTALVTGVLTTTATQVATGGITSGSNILSDTDSTDSLGSTAVRWLKGWFDALTAGTLTIGSGSVTDSSGAISFGDENLTTTGIVTAAGTSVFTNLDISGNVDIDGAATFNAGVTSSSLSSTETGRFHMIQEAAGNQTYPVYSFQGDGNTGMMSDTADTLSLVTGGTTRLNIDANGGIISTAIAGGHAVFNEGSVDADFRVESDGNANMLFVDGGANKVVIGAATSSGSTLGIYGDASATHLSHFYSATAGDLNNPAIYITKTDSNTTASQAFVAFVTSGSASGEIVANGASQVAFGSWSDRRLKENIEDLPSQLGNITSLRPVEFDYKDGSGHQIGFIAQELQGVYPDAVSENSDTGMLKVAGWTKNEAIFVKAMQEQQELIKTLEARILELSDVVATLVADLGIT
jgi:carbon monoxide dehydrogenase subunit G